MSETGEESEKASDVIYTPVDPENPSKEYKPKPIKQGPPTTVGSAELPAPRPKRITYPNR